MWSALAPEGNPVGNDALAPEGSPVGIRGMLLRGVAMAGRLSEELGRLFRAELSSPGKLMGSADRFL